MANFTKTPGKKWTAVRTRPRCEKVVKEHCNRYGIPNYLPLRRRVQRYQRRRVETFLPLFPGYLFAQLDDDSTQLILRSHKIVWIASITDREEDTLLNELEDIQQLEQIAREIPIAVRPQLVPGKAVHVTRGPMKGTTGVIENVHGKTRVNINVELLGQAASVDLDADEVEVDDS